MTHQGTYIDSRISYEIEIDYTYYEEDAPPYSNLEVESITFCNNDGESVDISSFIFEEADDYLEKIKNKIQEQKPWI